MGNQNYKILRKNKNSFIIEKDFFGLLIGLVIIAFMALRKIVPFLYLTQVIFIVFSCIYIVQNKNNIKFNKYILFYFLFIIWCFISILWSIDKIMALNKIISTTQIILICSFISIYLNSINKIERILYLISVASIIMVIYFILMTPMIDWIDAVKGSYAASSSQGRFGRSIGHHPNTFGDICTLSSLIWYYFFCRDRKKINLIFSILFIILILFSKSRLSLLILITNLVLFTVYYKRRKISTLLVIFLGMALSIIVVFWSVFNIPILYDLVGFRLSGLLGILNPNLVADQSTNTRMDMIVYGIEMFKENPILGVGIGNYAYYGYYKYGLFDTVYSHNNYIEMLANVGFIGWGLYYIIPFWSCIKLKKIIPFLDGNDRCLACFLFVIVLSRLIGDFGRVSYTDEIIQIMNVVCYCVTILFINSVKSKVNNR